MILTHNECSSITSTLEISDFTDYTIARVTINLNCCNDSTVYEISDLNATNILDDVYIDSNSNFVINNTLFNNDIIKDGVYTVQISLYQSNGSNYEDTGCIFIDCKTKCLVYEKLSYIEDEQEKMQLLMEHYSLTVGSNCSCECEKLCSIYKSLESKLEGINYDCGCL